MSDRRRRRAAPARVKRPPGAARTGPARRMGLLRPSPPIEEGQKRKGTRRNGCLPQQPGYQGGARTAGLSAFLASRSNLPNNAGDPVRFPRSRAAVDAASRTQCGGIAAPPLPPGAGQGRRLEAARSRGGTDLPQVGGSGPPSASNGISAGPPWRACLVTPIVLRLALRAATANRDHRLGQTNG